MAMAPLMMRRICPCRGSGISLMNCSSSGTTTPGSRKLALKVSTALVAASTSSKRAKYHGPLGARVTGSSRRSRASSSDSPSAVSGSKPMVTSLTGSLTRYLEVLGHVVEVGLLLHPVLDPPPVGRPYERIHVPE